jgi:hypothetical protein
MAHPLLEGDPANPREVDALVPLLGTTERIRLALFTRYVSTDAFKAKGAVVLITDEALYAFKDKLFGKPKIDLRVPLEDIDYVNSEPFDGAAFPAWIVTWRAGAVGSFLVSTADGASTAASTLSLGAGATRDADLAQFQRALDLGRQLQPGDDGSSLSAEQVVLESRSVRQMIADGRHQEAWARRVQLGYGVPSDGVPQADRFWIDAAPATAALQLGWKDHPMVTMCCGMAESNLDPRDPEQQAAVAKFNRLYHG